MLYLLRKPGQEILIGDKISIKVHALHGTWAELEIHPDAPYEAGIWEFLLRSSQVVGDGIIIELVNVYLNSARIGIEAPRTILVLRKELLDKQ